MKWIKNKLPANAGDYYCKCKVDGTVKRLIVEFDKNGRWGEAPDHDYYEDFEIIEWLAEDHEPVFTKDDLVKCWNKSHQVTYENTSFDRNANAIEADYSLIEKERDEFFKKKYNIDL